MTVLGREAYLPRDTQSWILFVVVLAVIAVSMNVVAGRSFSLVAVATAVVSYLYDYRIYIPVAIALVALLALAGGVRSAGELGPRRMASEVVLLSAGFLAYEVGRSEVIGAPADAHANALALMRFQDRLGPAIEPPLQRLVLRSDAVLDAVNWTYSFLFLSLVVAALFWLLLTDERVYRAYRTSLGVSALLAVVTIARFPLAPPRLTPESGLIDTHGFAGLSHGFVNQFAAMPSLHVGWTALAGYALFRSVRHPVRWLWAVAPVTVMGLTVMASGNHYWLDGVVGAGYALIPAFLLLRRDDAARTVAVARPRRTIRWGALVPDGIFRFQRAWAGVSGLVVLLVILLIRQVVDPGFTDYWGYMVAQISATILILNWLHAYFAREGGLSLLTYAVVTLETWIDTLGTAGHMYDRYDSYDKVAHFGGGVMLTAATADVLLKLQRRKGWNLSVPTLLTYAVGMSMLLNVGWEIYEVLGDRVFSTGRHAGSIDTGYDLISDLVGSVVVAVVIGRWQIGLETAMPHSAAEGASTAAERA